MELRPYENGDLGMTDVQVYRHLHLKKSREQIDNGVVSDL